MTYSSACIGGSGVDCISKSGFEGSRGDCSTELDVEGPGPESEGGSTAASSLRSG
ncbi:hypothetical protein PR002_g20532 [Phytophthora rubi]|uniref:Uncharacterized protein n=1 Tax=Phytophthora rubi TaxID=129364 RepID=A0A6A3JE24_9STRA|nr:hypothetical protein PR002_g20532 [Phytophthora rubi]